MNQTRKKHPLQVLGEIASEVAKYATVVKCAVDAIGREPMPPPAPRRRRRTTKKLPRP